MALSNKKRVILSKIEPIYGDTVDATMVASDAILCANLTINPLEGAVVERNLIRPYFGSSGSSRAESFATLSFDTELSSGAGLYLTPQWDNLIKSCSFSSTVMPATPLRQTGSSPVPIVGTVSVPTPITGVVGQTWAAGSVNTTLGATASSVDGFYFGWNITVGGQACGVITGYEGRTKAATFSIAALAQTSGTTAYSLLGSATSVVFGGTVSSVDSFYVGWTIKVGTQNCGVITSYSGSTKTATITHASSMAQTPGTTYQLINGSIQSGIASAAQIAGATLVALASTASTADGYYVGCAILVGTQNCGIITGYVGATKIATVSVPVTAAQTTATTYEIQGVFNNSRSAIRLAAGSSPVDGMYIGLTITVSTGANPAEEREIIAYNGSARTATLNAVLSVSPMPSTSYSLGACTVYLPASDVASSGNSSVTFVVNIDGENHVIYGARGTFSIDMTVKQLPMIKWSFTGMLGLFGAKPQIAGDFTGWKPPSVVSTVNTTQFGLCGYSPAISKLSIDIGNTITHRLLIGAEAVIASDRRPKGSITIDATAPGMIANYLGLIKADTPGSLYVRHGSAAGDWISISGPLVQLGAPKYAEQDGLVMLDLSLDFQPLLTPTSAGGNNELRIVCK